MLLYAQCALSHPLQVVTQVSKHFNASAQPIHTPTMLDLSRCSLKQQTTQYCELIGLKGDSRLVREVNLRILFSAMASDSHDQTHPSLNADDGHLPFEEFSNVEVNLVDLVLSIPGNENFEQALHHQV